MRQVPIVDENGLIVNIIEANDEQIALHEQGGLSLGENVVTAPVPPGLYKIKWDGEQWIEGLTQQEIDELTKPAPPSEIEIIGQQLVEKDLQILELQDENQTQGQLIVDLDLRLMQGGL